MNDELNPPGIPLLIIFKETDRFVFEIPFKSDPVSFRDWKYRQSENDMYFLGEEIMSGVNELLVNPEFLSEVHDDDDHDPVSGIWINDVSMLIEVLSHVRVAWGIGEIRCLLPNDNDSNLIQVAPGIFVSPGVNRRFLTA